MIFVTMMRNLISPRSQLFRICFLFSLEGSVFHIFVLKSHTFHGRQPNSVILGMLFFEKAVMTMMTYKGDGEGQFEIIL